MGCIKQEDLAKLEAIRKIIEIKTIDEPMAEEVYDEVEIDSFRDWTGED